MTKENEKNSKIKRLQEEKKEKLENNEKKIVEQICNIPKVHKKKLKEIVDRMYEESQKRKLGVGNKRLLQMKLEKTQKGEFEEKNQKIKNKQQRKFSEEINESKIKKSSPSTYRINNTEAYEQKKSRKNKNEEIKEEFITKVF
jgi:hypothetical protein